MKKTTIVLADDHPMFRLGLRSAIEIKEQFEIIGEADDGHGALELIAWLKPQIAVLDLFLSTGQKVEARLVLTKRKFLFVSHLNPQT